jgi:GR25 family glycosyltransferase involved in LPS biosynthesis
MTFSFTNASCYLISLDAREDRRALFVANTDTQGFALNTFEWIRAIEDQDFGGLGCAKSHLLAMTKFMTKTENEWCCIFEDDFNFRDTRETTEQTIDYTLKKFSDLDVFLLGGTKLVPMPTNAEIGMYKVNQVFESATTSGYIVRRRYVKQLMINCMDSIIGMEKFRAASPRSVIYHKFAIDQTWKKLQRTDNWYCTTPMLGAQIPSYSDIEKTDIDYTHTSA